MKGFISTKKLNLLLRKNTKKEVLYMYINYKINLHRKQLDKVFGLKEV